MRRRQWHGAGRSLVQKLLQVALVACLMTRADDRAIFGQHEVGVIATWRVYYEVRALSAGGESDAPVAPRTKGRFRQRLIQRGIGQRL